MYLLSLAACLNEQGFETVTPDDDDDAPSSPWDHLDAGTVPDLAFLALWDDVTDIDALDEDNDQYPCLPGPTLWDPVRSAPNLDLLDVRGQVIGRIPLPAPLDEYDEPTLQALGPTQALLIDGRYQPRRHAWEIDAEALTSRELASWGLGNLQPFTVLGVEQPLPAGFTDLHPTRIGDTLYVALEAGGAVTPPPVTAPALYAFDLLDPAAAPRVWTVADLLPPELAAAEPAPQLYITHLHPANGELVMQITAFGPSWDGSDDASDWRYVREVFLPETGTRSWTIDISHLAFESWTEPVHRHDETDRSALFTEYAWQQPHAALLLYDTQRDPREIHPPDNTCLGGLAILDAAAPTVMYSRHLPDGPDDYSTSIVVHHGAREVWRIDALQVGLGERKAHVRSLVVLEPQ